MASSILKAMDVSRGWGCYIQHTNCTVNINGIQLSQKINHWKHTMKYQKKETINNSIQSEMIWTWHEFNTRDWIAAYGSNNAFPSFDIEMTWNDSSKVVKGCLSKSRKPEYIHNITPIFKLFHRHLAKSLPLTSSSVGRASREATAWLGRSAYEMQ